MSLKAKLTQKSVVSTSTTEKVPSELFINLGFTIDIGGKPTFVNLPLTLTADRLAEVIEKQRATISQNSPASWVELVQGRISIAEAVQALFDQLDKGESVLAQDINEDNQDFGFLRTLEIQFTKRSEQVEVETSDVRQTILDKFRNR